MNDPSKKKEKTVFRSRQSDQAQGEPQAYQWITQWLAELMGQGIEAAHVFCGTDDAEMTYSIWSNQVPVSIGSRNFIIIELPNDPMDGPGYRVFDKGK